MLSIEDKLRERVCKEAGVALAELPAEGKAAVTKAVREWMGRRSVSQAAVAALAATIRQRYGGAVPARTQGQPNHHRTQPHPDGDTRQADATSGQSAGGPLSVPPPRSTASQQQQAPLARHTLSSTSRVGVDALGHDDSDLLVLDALRQQQHRMQHVDLVVGAATPDHRQNPCTNTTTSGGPTRRPTPPPLCARTLQAAQRKSLPPGVNTSVGIDHNNQLLAANDMLAAGRSASAPLLADDHQRAVAIGALRPHMLRRIRLLKADGAFRDAIAADRAQLDAEKAAAAAAKQDKRNAMHEEMCRQESERQATLAAARKEREEARQRAALEQRESAAEQRDRLKARQEERREQKKFLHEQRTLRAQAKAQQERERRQEDDRLREGMIAAEARRAEEDLVRRHLLRDGIHEYLSEGRVAVAVQEERRRNEVLAERERDNAAALEAARMDQRKRRHAHPDDASCTSAGAAHNGRASGSVGGVGAALGLRDTGRSPKVRKRLERVKAMQSAAARHLEALREKTCAEQKAREEAARAEMAAQAAAMEARHEAEKAKRREQRHDLIAGLDVELSIHEQRKAKTEEEKRRGREAVDAEAARLLQAQREAQLQKQARKQQFVEEIAVQRQHRFERMLDPLCIKLNSASPSPNVSNNVSMMGTQDGSSPSRARRPRTYF